MIIFIESNTSGTGEYFYKLCKKKNINFIFFVKNIHKYQWLKKPYFKLVNTSNFFDMNKNIEILRKKNKIRCIISTSDQFVITCNKLSKKFNLEFENVHLLNTFKNKFECLRLMNKLQAVKRNFFLIKNDKSLKKNIKFPCILKPNNGTGSIDVYKIKNQVELKKNIKILKKKYDKLILDEYVDGKEYSLEVLFIKNKIIFEQLVVKKINDNHHFVESGHEIFPKYGAKIIKIKKQLINIIKEFNLNKMFLHIEFKIDRNDNLEIIEINPRLAGGFIPILIKYFNNLDLINLYIDIISGKKIKKIILKKNNYVYKIFFLIPPKSNKLRSIVISNKIKNFIIEKKIYKDKIKNFTQFSYDFSDRLGHIIFKAKNIYELNHKEKKIRANLKFIY